MALVSVLWGIALLSIIALSFLSSGTTSYRIAANLTEAAKVDAVAEGAVTRAVLALLDTRPARRWRVDNVAYTLELQGQPVKVSLQDELGRIDLNYADQALLLRLFQSAGGLDIDSATRLVDRILDWRSEGTFRKGPNAGDYDAIGSPSLIRHGAFQSVDELKLIVGVTTNLFRSVEPALTVYSGSQFFDPRVAPREALLALSTMDDAKVDAIILSRHDGDGPVPTTAITLAGHAFTVRIELERSNGALVREAVIRLTDDSRNPYWFLSWKAK